MTKARRRGEGGGVDESKQTEQRDGSFYLPSLRVKRVGVSGNGRELRFWGLVVGEGDDGGGWWSGIRWGNRRWAAPTAEQAALDEEEPIVCIFGVGAVETVGRVWGFEGSDLGRWGFEFGGEGR